MTIDEQFQEQLKITKEDIMAAIRPDHNESWPSFFRRMEEELERARQTFQNLVFLDNAS